MSRRPYLSSCAVVASAALLASCSLIFSESTEEPVDPVPTIEGDYYISPMGDDSADGIVPERPLRTWRAALSLLAPGDILVVLPGVYSDEAEEGEPTGLPNIDCDSAEASTCEGVCANGAVGSPIVVRASLSREATLRPSQNWDKEALKIKRCTAWTIEGLVIEGADTEETDPDEDDIVRVSGGSDVTLRDVVVHKDNQAVGGELLTSSNTSNLTIEDSAFYDFRNKAMVLSGSDKLNIRRVHISGAESLGGDATGDDGCLGRGDIAVQVSGSTNVRFENVVIEGACDGILIQPMDGGQSSTGVDVSSNAQILGSMIGVSNRGVICEGACELCSTQECCDTVGACEGLQIENSVILGASTGVSMEIPANVVLSQLTIVEADKVGVGIYAEEDDDDNPISRAPTALSAEVTQSLFIQAGIGLDATALPDDTIFSVSNVDASDEVVLPVNLSNASLLALDTMHDGCFAQPGEYWLGLDPDFGVGRVMVGANIIHRSVDGAETGEDLWTPDGYPCGAQVPGVSDTAQRDCLDIHTRFGIGGENCPLPPSL